MTTLIDVKGTLDTIVSTVSEMTDEELISAQLLIERAYVHIMIERSLRSGDRVSGMIRDLGSG